MDLATEGIALTRCVRLTICFCHWQAFKHGNVDLPAEGATMPDAVITLPDNFNGADFLGGLSIECALSHACAAAYHQHLFSYAALAAAVCDLGNMWLCRTIRV